jgi:hypothetical protein
VHDIIPSDMGLTPPIPIVVIFFSICPGSEDFENNNAKNELIAYRRRAYW